MLELPNVNFSKLTHEDELRIVGLKNMNDLVKPTIEAFLKDSVQRQIKACNLSEAACNELLSELDNQGFNISLDSNIAPDASNLPTSFSDTECEDENEYSVDCRRALNYASWMLAPSSLCKIEQFFSDCKPKLAKYPFNLLNVIFGETKGYSFNSHELASITEKIINTVLDTLTQSEGIVVRLIYKEGVSANDICRYLNIRNNMIAIKAINLSIERMLSKSLRKMRHPSRTQKLRLPLLLCSYLEDNEDATFNDIKNSFLHEQALTWKLKNPQEDKDTETINWDRQKSDPFVQSLFDTNDISVKLILEANKYRWLPWPIGLLASSLSIIQPNIKELSVQNAYFSTNPNFGHYIFINGYSDNNEERYCLFEFIEGMLITIHLDAPVLKNLWRIVTSNIIENPRINSLHALYNAESQYCQILLELVSDPMEKAFFQMSLTMITDTIRHLPPEDADRVLDMLIEDLDLGVKAFNCLKRAGINTVEDLVQKTEEEMMQVRNLGRRSLEEVIDKVHMLGIKFKWES